MLWYLAPNKQARWLCWLSRLLPMCLSMRPPSMSLPPCLPYHTLVPTLCAHVSVSVRVRGCITLFLSRQRRSSDGDRRQALAFAHGALYIFLVSLFAQGRMRHLLHFGPWRRLRILFGVKCSTHRTATYQRRIEYVRTLTISILVICNLYLPHGSVAWPHNDLKTTLAARCAGAILESPDVVPTIRTHFSSRERGRMGVYRAKMAAQRTRDHTHLDLDISSFVTWICTIPPPCSDLISYRRAAESSSLVRSRCGACGQKVFSSYIHSRCFSFASKY